MWVVAERLELPHHSGGEAIFHLHGDGAVGGAAEDGKEAGELEGGLGIEVLIEEANERLVNSGGDPGIAGSADRSDRVRLSPRCIEHDRRSERASVAREGEASPVGGGVGAVRRELVVVDEAEPRRDVEVPAPGPQCLRDGDDIAFRVRDGERGRA